MDKINGGAEVLWVAHNTLPQHWGTLPHTHEEFFHLSYVAKGDAVFQLNEMECHATEFNCINVPPNVTHSIKTCDSECEIYEIKYAVSNPELLHNLLMLSGYFKCDDFTSEMISSIVGKGRRRTVFSRHADNRMLEAALYHVCDLYGNEDDDSGAFLNTEGYSELTKNAIKYVNLNYMNDLTIDIIANAIGFSKAYTCIAFKRDSGMTISAYLNYVRVFNAAEAIAYGDYTLQQVCSKVGFSSMSYFIKTFKGIVGITPGQYRRAFPDDIFTVSDVDSDQEGYTLPVWAGRALNRNSDKTQSSSGTPSELAQGTDER